MRVKTRQLHIMFSKSKKNHLLKLKNIVKQSHQPSIIVRSRQMQYSYVTTPSFKSDRRMEVSGANTHAYFV